MPYVPNGTARLDIESFTTRLYVRDAAGVFSDHDVMPDVSLLRDRRLPTTAEFQAEADDVLAGLGLTRAGDWASSGGEWTAPVEAVAPVQVMAAPGPNTTEYKADGSGVLGCRCVFRLVGEHEWDRVPDSDQYCPALGHGALYEEDWD